MKERLPVEIENFELPEDEFKKLNPPRKESYSYGFISIIQLLSLIITLVSFWVVLFFGNR